MPTGSPRALVPRDAAGLRSNQLNLLNSIFGGNGQLPSMFGQVGSPQTDLQRQSAGDIGQFLRQPAPEQRALDVAMPGLQEILTGGGPQFERDLAMANQQGGRFGSANAIFRGEAHRNLLNARNDAANTLGFLSQAAGQNPFQRLMGGFGVGQQQAQQGDIETQRRLQILMQLLGVGQQTALNAPIQQGGGLGSLLTGILGMGAGSFLGPLLGGLGTNVANNMVKPQGSP